MVLDLQKKEERLVELEKQVRFLRSYEADPLSREFQGDITLVGRDGALVYAHRFILVGKSCVFRKMFENEMREKRSGIIHINDADASVLRSMVSFCYKAEVEFTEESPAEEVLKVAEKYDIPDLKALCEKELSASVTEENLFKRIKLAHTYHAESLITATRVFYNSRNCYKLLADNLCKNSSLD